MTSLSPPRSLGSDDSVSTFRPWRAGVRLVHLEEVAGEQVGLLTALGPADLDDHVAPGVGIGRHQQRPQLRLYGLQGVAGGGQLGLQRGAFVAGGDRSAARWPPRGRR